jgi:hypothetical protein
MKKNSVQKVEELAAKGYILGVANFGPPHIDVLILPVVMW